MPSALVNRPGEDVEAVVSMMLCRRHERAARRRAGQGDRGVDVFVPVSQGRVDVYQVKRYDRSLGATQWREIRNSYNTLVKAVTAGHLRVRRWYLVLPLDQSDADETKFSQLVAGSPFKRCEWKGLAWLDALTSQYPEVIDYYLGDGKARLEQAHRDLLSVLQAGNTTVRDAAGSSDTSDGLTALHRTLNRYDPHYRYDFAVGNAKDRDSFLPSTPPRTLVFITQHSDGDTCVTWYVHARCDESVRDRPIPINLRFDPDQDPTLRESLRLFADYGKPFSAGQGAATISADLPGGLGSIDRQGSMWMGPTAEDQARGYVLRLRAIRPDGTVAGPVRLDMAAPTVGARGTRIAGEHDGGAFAFEGLHDYEPTSLHVSFQGHELTGKPAATVIGGVEFLAGVAGRLEIAAEHGPFLRFGDVPSQEGRGSSTEGGEDTAVLDALRALATIQEHTTTTVLVPDLEQVTVGDVREWQNVAAILAGQTVVDRRLGEMTTQLTEPQQELNGDHAIAFLTGLSVSIGEQRLTLGQQWLHVASARVVSDREHPGRVTVTPLAGASWTRALAPPQ